MKELTKNLGKLKDPNITYDFVKAISTNFEKQSLSLRFCSEIITTIHENLLLSKNEQLKECFINNNPYIVTHTC